MFICVTLLLLILSHQLLFFFQVTGSLYLNSFLLIHWYFRIYTHKQGRYMVIWDNSSWACAWSCPVFQVPSDEGILSLSINIRYHDYCLDYGFVVSFFCFELFRFSWWLCKTRHQVSIMREISDSQRWWSLFSRSTGLLVLQFSRLEGRGLSRVSI